MNQELESAIVTKIKESYAESQTLAAFAKDNARQAIAKAVECGQFLLEAKQTSSHGKWIEWLNTNCGSYLSVRTAQKFMSLAEFVNSGGTIEDCASTRQALQIAGILPQSEYTTSGQINRDPEGTNWIGALSKVTMTVEKIFDSRPISQWPQDERDIFVERARPVVKRFLEAGGKV